tara:strand:- start:189 stop:566 length:378 start_codon:yes stop_codon:yes gene_type:complete
MKQTGSIIFLIFFSVGVIGYFNHEELEKGVKDTTVKILREQGYKAYIPWRSSSEPDFLTIQINSIKVPYSFTFLNKSVTADVFYTYKGKDSFMEIEVKHTESKIPLVNIFGSYEYYVSISFEQLP